MASTALRDVLNLLSASSLGVETPIDDFRAAYRMLGSMLPRDADVAVEPGQVGGVPGEWHTPPGADATRALLYLHGGGYVIGGPDSHRSMLTHLAREYGARIFAADYRLAPEHPCPAAVDDAAAAFRGLLAEGHDAARLTIAGDSAGGGLALAALMRLRDEGVALPGAAVLLSPWCDLTQSGPSARTFAATDPMVHPADLERWVSLYCVGSAPGSPIASPLFGDLSGLPPLLVHVGDQEVLLDDSRRLAERARAAGVEVELHVAAEMIHVWHFFAGQVPESDDAVAAIGRWLRARG